MQNCYNAGDIFNETKGSYRNTNVTVDSRYNHIIDCYYKECSNPIEERRVYDESITGKAERVSSVSSHDFASKLNSNIDNITITDGISRWIFTSNYPLPDTQIDEDLLDSDLDIEEVENVEDKTVTGNGTITFENLKPLSRKIYLVKQVKVERCDINTKEWKTLTKGEDYTVEENENTITYFIINNKKVTENGIIYQLDKEQKTATVIGINDDIKNNENLELSIPETIQDNEKEYRVAKIASDALNGGKFKKVNLPINLEIIEENAFNNCTNLQEISIPKNVSSLHINAFPTHKVVINIDPENPNYIIEDGILYNKEKTILYGATRTIDIESFTVPASVIEIKENALKCCTNLKEITIERNVQTIGNNIFADEIKGNLTIKGYKNSRAEIYATENSINFEKLDTDYFIWGEDNYNFTNNSPYFSSYDIGDIIYNHLSNTYQEQYNSGDKNVKWSGSCSGITMSTMLFKNGNLTPQYWQVDANCEYDLNYKAKQNDGITLINMINFYQVFYDYMITHMYQKIDVTSNGEGEIEGFYKGVENAYNNNSNQLLFCEFRWGNDIRTCCCNKRCSTDT